MEDMRGYESALGVGAVQVQGAPWVLQLGHEVGPVVEGVRHEWRQEAAPPHCVVHSGCGEVLVGVLEHGGGVSRREGWGGLGEPWSPWKVATVPTARHCAVYIHNSRSVTHRRSTLPQPCLQLIPHNYHTPKITSTTQVEKEILGETNCVVLLVVLY